MTNTIIQDFLLGSDKRKGHVQELYDGKVKPEPGATFFF